MLKRKVPSVLLSTFLSFTLSTQAVFAQGADVAARIHILTTSKSIIKVGSALFETDDMVKFYSLRNFAPVWTQNGIGTEFVANLKQTIQEISIKHGLVASDYWTPELESYYNNLNQNNALAFELAATQAFLLLGMHLSDGRIDPTFVDNDVRFRKREFVDHRALAQAASASQELMKGIVEALAPQHTLYKTTLSVLEELRKIKASGGFKAIRKPGVDIKVGDSNKIIPLLRLRLKQLGYDVEVSESKVYDNKLAEKVQEMQQEYGFEVKPGLLRNVSFLWKALAPSLDERISQAEATLEKLRWLPKQLEPNMIFVNTAATVIKVYENNQVINEFRTINGKSLRRTPMMKTWITRVVINPRWTATDSIVLQDKLPEIIKDPTYLNRIRMRVFNRATRQVVDPTTLNWASEGRKIARQNYFVMDPGPSNALGVYKFPLAPDPSKPSVSNSDAIFMHYTDNPKLFEGNSSRLLSSGCIRLEKADWLAAYLLKNIPGYDAASIQAMTAKGVEGEVFQTDKTVILPESDYRAVYTVPITVEKTVSGKLRLMEDAYKHDNRIDATVMSGAVRAQVNQQVVNTQVGLKVGALSVVGTPGSTQQFAEVVAIRCKGYQSNTPAVANISENKEKCDKPVKFSLNTAQALPAGQYIVGFENSLFPGFVNVGEGQVTTIQLQRIDIPKSYGKDRSLKVYRDFTSQIEQKKVYFEKFYFGKNVFRQTVRKFGDFYLAGINDIDIATPSNYKFCSQAGFSELKAPRDLREQTKFVCESFIHAKTMMDYADLYRFDNRGGYQEAVVDSTGDIVPKKMLRHLVATPVRAGDFVSVLPGAYRIVGESGPPEAVPITSNFIENYGDLTRTFVNSMSKKDETVVDDSDLDPTAGTLLNDAGVSINTLSNTSAGGHCSQAVLWRTEKRSYCTLKEKDSDGCDRSKAQMCEEMSLDLRFRK